MPTRLAGPASANQRVYPFGISRKRLEQAMRDTASGARIADRLEDTDVVLTDRSYYRRKPQALREAEARGIPIYVLKSNTLLQMEQALLSMQADGRRQQDPVLDAMTEAEEAIQTVMSQDRPVELTPQRAYIRRLQHELAQRFNLTSRSRGREPQRRVRILPGAGGPTAFFGRRRGLSLAPRQAGLFITFEGGEGSGKSTQAALLARASGSARPASHALREPGGTTLGEELRRLLLHRTKRSSTEDGAAAVPRRARRARERGRSGRRSSGQRSSSATASRTRPSRTRATAAASTSPQSGR